MKKKPKTFLLRYEKLQILLIITGFLLVGFLFDLSILLPASGRLDGLFKTAESFALQFGRSAETLRELEMYEKKDLFLQQKSRPSLGEFSYQRLNHKFFVVQEFLENKKHSLNSLSNVVLKNQIFVLPTQELIQFFPFEILDGISTKALDVGLIADNERGEKHLVATIKQLKITLVAPHSFVDEYYVLPGEHKIIFTASAKNNWPSGLFVWDLDDSNVQLISDSLNLNITKSALSSQVTLVGINAEWVYFFSKSNSSDIFDCHNLYGYNLTNQKISAKPDRCLPNKLFNALPFLSNSEIAKNLRTQSLEKTIEWWQDYLAHIGHEQASSAHALWILANLYFELGLSPKVPTKQKKTLEIFAREILAQITKMKTSPQYLRELSARSLAASNLASGLRFRFTSGEVLAQ